LTAPPPTFIVSNAVTAAACGVGGATAACGGGGAAAAVVSCANLWLLLLLPFQQPRPRAVAPRAPAIRPHHGFRGEFGWLLQCYMFSWMQLFICVVRTQQQIHNNAAAVRFFWAAFVFRGTHGQQRVLLRTHNYSQTPV
jgi:hypothetical protein